MSGRTSLRGDLGVKMVFRGVPRKDLGRGIPAEGAMGAMVPKEGMSLVHLRNRKKMGGAAASD